MKLLIHDYSAAEWERVADRFRGWTVISENGPIRPCIGCFTCWISGTGECAFRDGFERMGALIHEAEEVTVISRYTYGGFSGFVKNVFDRCIGYVLPEFETAYGEMHHRKRYREEKPVTFVFRGTGLSENEKEKAREYVSAVCRNLRGRVKEVLFEEAEEAADASSSGCGGSEREGILFVNCSLRGKRSNTGLFLNKLEEYLGMPVKQLRLQPRTDLDGVAEEIGKAKILVTGIPLYVDGLPSSAIRLMEAVKEKNAGTGCRVYAVVDNGLYESSQNGNLLSMIRSWCKDIGAEYRGSAAIGASEVVGTLMRDRKRYLWPAQNALHALDRLAGAIDAGSGTEDLFADLYRFPRSLYILIADTNWQVLRFSDRGRQRAGLLQ